MPRAWFPSLLNGLFGVQPYVALRPRDDVGLVNGASNSGPRRFFTSLRTHPSVDEGLLPLYHIPGQGHVTVSRLNRDGLSSAILDALQRIEAKFNSFQQQQQQQQQQQAAHIPFVLEQVPLANAEATAIDATIEELRATVNLLNDQQIDMFDHQSNMIEDLFQAAEDCQADFEAHMMNDLRAIVALAGAVHGDRATAVNNFISRTTAAHAHNKAALDAILCLLVFIAVCCAIAVFQYFSITTIFLSVTGVVLFISIVVINPELLIAILPVVIFYLKSDAFLSPTNLMTISA